MAITGDMATFSLSKTTSLLSPSPQNSRTFSVSLTLSPPPISPLRANFFLKPSLNHHFRPSVLRSPPSNGGIELSSENDEGNDDDDEEEEILDYEGYQSEGSDEDFIIDEEELEAEARAVVREFSTSLSRELRIGT